VADGGAMKRKSDNRILVKFTGEVNAGRVFPQHAENEAIEREISQACKEGERVGVLIYKLVPATK